MRRRRRPLARRDERWQIRVRGLHKTFGPQHVLRGIDLDIERGRTNIIIGGSGQGKSVLMKHLMGLLKPDAGQIWVDGEDVVPFSTTSRWGRCAASSAWCSSTRRCSTR